jgi:hypothetical protein
MTTLSVKAFASVIVLVTQQILVPRKMVGANLVIIGAEERVLHWI